MWYWPELFIDKKGLKNTANTHINNNRDDTNSVKKKDPSKKTLRQKRMRAGTVRMQREIWGSVQIVVYVCMRNVLD